jgi:hypothetical protein
MMMAVHESRQNDLAAQVDDGIGARWELIRGSDLLDHAVADKDSSVLELPTLGIHRYKNCSISC